MSTTVNKTPQKETHEEQRKRMEAAEKLQAARDGKLPGNDDINSGLSKAQTGLAHNDDQLSTTGKAVTKDLTNILETVKSGVNEKNKGNLLQKAYYHSNQTGQQKSFNQRISDLRKTVMGSGDSTQAREEARNNVTSMWTIVRLAFLSPEFRETINDMAQITNDLLKDREARQGVSSGVETINPPASQQVPLTTQQAQPMQAHSQVPSTGQHKMSQQEKEDRLVNRLVDLANTLHHNPEYRNSVMYMANSMEKLKNHAQTQKQEAKMSRQVDKAHEPTASKEYHKQEAQVNTKQFVENWIGDDYTLDRLLNQINFLYEQSRQDPELRSLLNDWKQWSTATVKDSSYVEDRERVRRDVKDLIHRTRLVLNGPYREQVNILRREVIYINKALQRDNTVQDLRGDLSQLGRDILNDQNGRPVLKPELIGDAQKIIAGVLESIKYIPLPPIHRNDEEMELQLENIVLTATEVAPSSVRVIMQTDAEKTGADQSRQNDNSFILELSKIRAHLTSINFFVDKKTGFPKVTDRGLADIDMMGTNGLSLRIEVAPRVQKTGNNVQSMFEAKSVNCTIDKLKIHLRETKHDLLYKIVGPVLNAMAKKRMETGIEDAIREQISKFNHVASEGATDAAHRTEQKVHESDRVQTGSNNKSSTQPPLANQPPKMSTTAGPSKPMSSTNNQHPVASTPIYNPAKPTHENPSTMSNNANGTL